MCEIIGREGSNIKICALIPQKESFNEDYFQTPPGFNMIKLLYSDDIRSNWDIMNKMIKVNESNNKKLIKKINISFNCRHFENVSLQKFYSTLQALALEESNIEQVEDTLQPHSEGLEKVLNGLDENFRSSIFGNTGGKTDELVKQYINGKKRNRSKSEDSLSDKGNKKNKNKKKKDISEDESDEKEEMGNYYSDEVIRKMMDNQKLKKMNVQELKDICRIRNISTKNLKKFEILEKIKIYLKEIDD